MSPKQWPKRRPPPSRVRKISRRARRLRIARERAFAAIPVANKEPILGTQNGTAPNSQAENITKITSAVGHPNPSSPTAQQTSNDNVSVIPMFEEVILKPLQSSSPISSENPLSPPPALQEEAEVAPSRRVINYEHFAREHIALGEHSIRCRNGRYQLVQEIIRDLESDFVYQCLKCKRKKTISTDPEPESINEAFICGGVSVGFTYPQLQEVLSAAEMPKMSEVNYKIKESSVQMDVKLAETQESGLSVKEEWETAN